ncbi:hypothetical protein [Microbacterium alcoholitolerans]|uniref:hypothetical protein n=1 Tax=unclassified Microbacterium TaxID=2609290 RepID=UPI003D1775D9
MSVLRRLAMPAGAGLIAALLLSVLGVQTEFAWGWGVLVAAATPIFSLQMPDDARADAPGRALERSYVGSDVSRLAWAINLHGDSVSEAVTRRVRATLRRRLARHGIDLDDATQAEAVEERLGSGVWARLNGRVTSIRDIREALAAAERLVPPDTHDAIQRDAIQREQTP